MKVLFASFECYPFVKVGGLADVVGSLPKFLKKNKVDVRIVIPLHKKVDIGKHKIKKTDLKLLIPLNNEYIECYIWKGSLDSVAVYFVQNDRFFYRDEIYGTAEGDYYDNPLRFILFSRAVIETAKAVGFKPDVIHCHDMQTGLIPAYLKTLYRIDAFFQHTKTVFTIHNIAYQGLYGPEIHFIAGFAAYDFVPEKFEYYGKINFMKAGIVFADMVTTVSPTYAKMISTSSEGRGLEGVLAKCEKEGKLFGILNGIDYNEWNPETDPYIKANFNIKSLDNKEICKEELQQLCGFDISDVPIFGMVSRIDPLKGFDLLMKVIPKFLSEYNIRLVILGRGYKDIQARLQELQKNFTKKFKLFLEFNNPMAHKIYAGSDFFLMPSVSEPCGLSQMIAMTYGTAPIVYKTGGLADTVVQFNPQTATGTGFVFDTYNEGSFYNKLVETVEVYKNKKSMEILRKNMLQQNFSWDNSAMEYLKLYCKITNISLKVTKKETKIKNKSKK
ncbi:MAG: glycogen/starch synthase [Elusimicrobiota bacterium]|nr:glycogen/starch synthase [Elusimicrobiota bacterium]